MGSICSKEDDEWEERDFKSGSKNENIEQLEQEAERQEQEYFDELEPRKGWLLSYNEQNQKIPINLQHINYKVEILHSIAQVQLELNYINQTQQVLSVSFYFQISSDACFDKLEAQIGENRLIQAQVKCKEQGGVTQLKGDNLNNNGQLQQQQQIGFSQLIDDILEVQLGQCNPGEKIIVRFSYIEELFLEMGKFELILPYDILPPFNYVLSSQLLQQQSQQLYQQPRFNFNNQNNNGNNFYDNNYNNSLNMRQKTYQYTQQQGPPQGVLADLNPSDPMQYSWNIQIHAKSPGNRITLTDSLTHRLSIKKVNEYESFINVDNYQQRKEFIMHINYANPHSYLMEKNTEDLDVAMYCCLVNYIPEAVILQQRVNQEKFSLMACQGEFIFLLDRSGSMSGEKIDIAKDALCVFLKSLPVTAFFNVISFGSSFYSMEDISIRATDHNIEIAIQHIETMQADMGGTELMEPLEHIFHYQRNIEGFPRFIFLLTDGEVSTTDRVIDLIKHHNIHSEVFTLGVGHEVCPKLIKGAAAAGRGKFEFAHDHDHIKRHVVKLLRAAVSRELPTFNIAIDNNSQKHLDLMIPRPDREKLVKGGQAFNSFLFFSKNLQIENKIEIKFNFKLNKKIIEDRIIINLNNDCITDTKIFHKFAAHKALMKFQDNVQRHGDISDDLYFSPNFGQITVRGQQYALQYQVLCQQTGFVIIDTDLQQQLLQQQQQIQQQNVQRQKYIVSTRYATRSGFIHNEFSMFLHSKWKMDNQNQLPKQNQYNDTSYIDNYQLYQQQQQQLYGGGMGQQYQPQQQGQGAFYNYNQSNKSSRSQSYLSQAYVELIKAQRQQGYWEINDFNIQFLGLQNLQNVINSKPQEIQNLHAWFTILVIVFLQYKHKSDHHTWDLVVLKGQELLYSENINFNIYVDRARKTLGI